MPWVRPAASSRSTAGPWRQRMHLGRYGRIQAGCDQCLHLVEHGSVDRRRRCRQCPDVQTLDLHRVGEDQIVGVQTRVTAGGAEHGDPAGQGLGNRQAGRERGSSDGLEDQVDAPVRRMISSARSGLARSRTSSAPTARTMSCFAGGRRGDDPSAVVMGQPDSGLPHSACCRMDEHHLTAPTSPNGSNAARAVTQFSTMPRASASLQPDGTGSAPSAGMTLYSAKHPGARADDVIADGMWVIDPGPDTDDLADHFEACHVGRPRPASVGPARLHDVREVDARGAHADEVLAGSRGRAGRSLSRIRSSARGGTSGPALASSGQRRCCSLMLHAGT